jgi:hypothetical protein
MSEEERTKDLRNHLEKELGSTNKTQTRFSDTMKKNVKDIN